MRRFRHISEYKDFFSRNRESFSGVVCGFDEIARLYGRVRTLGMELEILDVLVHLFESMRPEFVPQLVRRLNGLLVEVLCGISRFDDKFVEFNGSRWGSLSAIVLATQRLGVGDEDGKKKKGGGVRLSGVSKSALRLVGAISGVEARAAESGLGAIVTLKRRGFQVD